MASESSCESDISESWSLVDINLNESGITSFKTYSIDKENENFSSEADNAEQVNSAIQNSGKIGSTQIKDEYDKIENVESEKLESSFQGDSLDYFSHEKQDSKDESSDEAKNDSCDGESIEILDIDGNYICEDPDIDRVAFTIIGDDETNDISHSNDNNYYYDNNFENSVLNVLSKRRRRRKSRSVSESSSNSNSDIMYYDEINSIFNLNVNTKMDDKLKMEKVKVTTKPIYRHCRNNFRNTALSLSLGVIFAGVACIAIGHFLGVHEAERTTDELMNTLKKLHLENFDLQYRLSKLDKGFASKNLNEKVKEQELYEIKHLHDSSQELADENTESRQNPAMNDRTTLNSFEWFSKFQNLLKTKEFVQNQHFNELKKIVLNIHDHLSFLNSKSKNHINLKNLEEKYYKISKVSQKILKKLTSSHEDLESSYQKLIELRDNLNKKLSKMFVEVSEKFCTAEQRNSHNCEEKKSVVEKINCELLRCGVENENENIVEEANESLLMYDFPQPEEYYLNKENSSTSSSITENNNLNGSSIRTNNNDETSSNKIEAIEQPKNSHDTMTETPKKTERKKGDSSNLKSKNKPVKRQEKREKEKKNRKKKEKQTSVFLNNEKQRVRRNEKSKKSNERSRNSAMKQKNNLYRNFNIKISDGEHKKKKDSIIASERDFKFWSKFVKNKSKNLKFRRIFKLKIIKENSYDPENNRTGFSLNPNFFSGNHSNYFNATGNWFFKWATGREQSRYHQGLGDWQFDRAKGRKVLRNEDVDINWHLKRALARQNNRNKNDLNEESYGRKNYGEKGFYHEELSWI